MVVNEVTSTNAQLVEMIAAPMDIAKNTFGSCSCHCNAGFQGDDVVCDDLDECSNGSNTCGDNSL